MSPNSQPHEKAFFQAAALTQEYASDEATAVGSFEVDWDRLVDEVKNGRF